MNLDKTFFTADLHLLHRALSERRGFASPEEMTYALVSRWNEVIYDDSYTVYWLGDVSDGNTSEVLDYLDQLNGRIRLIRGNHDKTLSGKILRRFDQVHDVLELKFKAKASPFAIDGEIRIWLSHYRHVVWPESFYGSLHCFGHSHGMLKQCPNPRTIDVGIDATGEIALSLREVLARIELQVSDAAIKFW